MRKIGYPRPTCQECGYVELEDRNFYAWQFFQKHSRLILRKTNLGAEIRMEAVKEIIDETKEVDSAYLLSLRLATILKVSEEVQREYNG